MYKLWSVASICCQYWREPKVEALQALRLRRQRRRVDGAWGRDIIFPTQLRGLVERCQPKIILAHFSFTEHFWQNSGIVIEQVSSSCWIFCSSQYYEYIKSIGTFILATLATLQDMPQYLGPGPISHCLPGFSPVGLLVVEVVLSDQVGRGRLVCFEYSCLLSTLLFSLTFSVLLLSCIFRYVLNFSNQG